MPFGVDTVAKGEPVKAVSRPVAVFRAKPYTPAAAAWAV